jgi:periplasmic protein TonB
MKIVIHLMLLLLLPAAVLYAQQEEAETPDASPGRLTEEQRAEYSDKLTDPPEVIGGLDAVREILRYPKELAESNIQGTVLITAYVGEDGTVHDAETLRSVHPDLDASALQAVLQLRFKPAELHGKAAKSRITIPIRFRAEE